MLCVRVCLQFLTGCEDQLSQMKSVRNQRLQLLQRRDRDTYDAVQWLDRHQQNFKQHIFEPILLSVSVPWVGVVYV